MLRATDPTKPPSRELLFLELRAIWELSAFFASYPLLRMAPRGDGHAVLVLPGLAANDTSTRPLRRFLTDQGWDANGWELGHNHGPRPGAEEKMQNRLATLFRDSGRKVSLVGWSLGGVFAREMARREPDHVVGMHADFRQHHDHIHRLLGHHFVHVGVGRHGIPLARTAGALGELVADRNQAPIRDLGVSKEFEVALRDATAPEKGEA